jgi:hypothetical protein
MFSGGATPPLMGAGPSWASMTGNMSGGGMGGGAVDQMPANPSMGGMWSGPAPIPSMGGGIGQASPPPGLAGMFSGGATPPLMGAGPGWSASLSPGMGGAGMGGGFVSQMPSPPNPSMGGVGQMPAFQPPQPMPFTNRPMPQWGAPNFSLQSGTIGAPQPSPMNGMMKGMFGVR